MSGSYQKLLKWYCRHCDKEFDSLTEYVNHECKKNENKKT